MKLKVFVISLVLLLSVILPVAAAAEDQPFTLAAPVNLTAELKYDYESIPYFELKLNVPQSVTGINENILSGAYSDIMTEEICVQFDYKYGTYDWNEGDSFLWNTSVYLTEFLEDGCFEYYPWGESGPDDELNIEAGVYQFRAYFYTTWGYIDGWMDKNIVSPYSNAVTIGNPSYYSGASSWAKAELDKAVSYGFITERIKGNMGADITREEFAEVAVKVYEKYTGTAAAYSDTSVFTDTSNPEIFKAYELKIVNGVGNGKFAPNTPITRDQMAAMLYRLVEAMAPDTDFSTADAPTFSDEKDIPSWAVNEVKFMSKHGFINGMGGNRFEPGFTSKREQAVAVAVRVYEYYAAI
jgi:hypothetical protein